MGLPTALQAGEESHRRDLSSEFITVGDADIFLHPQFFSTVIFESQRSTEDSATVVLSYGIFGDVRLGEPLDPVLRFSTRLHLVHDAAYQACHRLFQGGGSDVIAEAWRHS